MPLASLLTQTYLEIFLTGVVWTLDTSDNNLELITDWKIYLNREWLISF